MGVLSVSFSPDGKTIATGGVDQCVRIWDIAKRKNTKTFKGHGNSVRALVFSPNGKCLVSATNTRQPLKQPEGEIFCWDLAGGRILSRLAVKEGAVCLAFSPDGKTLAAGDRNRGSVIRLFDVSKVLDRHETDAKG